MENLDTLHVSNSLSKDKKEKFVPVNGNDVQIYICGPTVYSDSHLGHARTYVCFDTIKKLLRDYFGYNVKFAMNITDIDDKIINASKESGKDFLDIARYYEKQFLEDMGKLNVEMPDVLTRVTEYMPEIIKFIEKIIDNGFAYESKGSVYFDVEAYSADPDHSYAKLKPTAVGDAQALADGEGVLVGAVIEKRSNKDFALWKASKEGEPKWESTWGPGRPGWHIECSAMVNEIFPSWPIDVHGGGIDLQFPHHDNEIAQSEAYLGCDQWIKYFWHTGHLNIDGLKMSKSLKNFIKIDELLKEHSSR